MHPRWKGNIQNCGLLLVSVMRIFPLRRWKELFQSFVGVTQLRFDCNLASSVFTRSLGVVQDLTRMLLSLLLSQSLAVLAARAALSCGSSGALPKLSFSSKMVGMSLQ